MGIKSPDSLIVGDREWVCLGVITKPKGVRGQVRITSFTTRPEDLVVYGPLFDGPGGRVIAVALRETLKGGVVIAVIDGVTDRDAAEALRDVKLYVPREALPKAAGDEFYHADLIGLAVEDADGVRIGSVAAMHNFGAGDILEVMCPDGDSLMLPFTRDAVPKIDINGGRIITATYSSVANSKRDEFAAKNNTAPVWRVTVLTLFPEMFPGPLGHSLAGKALDAGIWALESVDIRRYARDKHSSVDDNAFGGGPGMVMRADILGAAIDDVCGGNDDGARVFLTPRGRPLDQSRVRALSKDTRLTLVCGRYEGIDERLIEARGLEEICLGDYILSGGEVAAMALIDACVRMLPGVVGDPGSLDEESFENGLLAYPQYTRPAVWEGRAVPEVLLSGHHERIRAWRRAEAESTTRERRDDLWARYGSGGT